MIVKLDRDFVSEKMEDFCLGLLSMEEFQSLRQMIENFLADEVAQDQYDEFVKQYEAFEAREKEVGLSEEEVARLEETELALYENDVIREYLFAQREFNTIHDLMSQYFIKTIELNRLPTSRDLKKEGCGCGGACGGH